MAEVNRRLICEHCGANLLGEGITEVSEGGHAETPITVKDRKIVFGSTAIENPDSTYAICNACGKELEEPIDDIVWAMEDTVEEIEDKDVELEKVKEAYRELWRAIENGTVEEQFFKLREKIRETLK